MARHRCRARQAAGTRATARTAGARRQDPRLLERADDQRPGDRRARARARGPGRLRRAGAGFHARHTVARRPAAGDHKDGSAHLAAYLDDYAFLLDALLELQQVRVRGDELAFAQQLAEVCWALRGPAGGGFFFTADDHETLIHRRKTFSDDATPSGNGIAARVAAAAGLPARRAALSGSGRAHAARRRGRRWALEELGHALAPGGFLPTALAGALLAAARPADGETRKLLAGLADGFTVRGRRAGPRADRHGHRRRPHPRRRIGPGPGAGPGRPRRAAGADRDAGTVGRG